VCYGYGDMEKKSKAKIKPRGRPRLRAECEYVTITISIPGWMARKLSDIFLQKMEPSRKKLIEWYLAKCLGYSKKTYAKKCKEEARKESKQ